MAAPTFVAAGTYQSDSGASVSLPVPAGAVAGRVVVVVMFINGTAITVTPPSGFVYAEGCPVQLPVVGGSHGLHVFWKRLTGTDAGTYDFTWPESRFREGAALLYDNVVSSGTPFDSPTSTAQDQANSSTTPPVSVTSLGPDRLLLWAATCWAGGTWTPPTGFTKRVQGGAGLVTLADRSWPTASSTGAVTGSTTNSDKRTAFLGALIGTTQAGTDVPVGQAQETDTASALTRSTSRALGQAVVSDTAMAVVPARSRLVLMATATDTATTVGPQRSAMVRQPVEEDAAAAFTTTRAARLGQPAETTTGAQAPPMKASRLTAAVEVGGAGAVAAGKARGVGQPAEVATARPVGAAKAGALRQAAGTEAAGVLLPGGRVALTQAVEADSALGLGAGVRDGLGLAVEESTPGALGRGKGRLLAVAVEASRVGRVFRKPTVGAAYGGGAFTVGFGGSASEET